MVFTMKCPRCGAVLERASFRDRIKYHCHHCGGSLVSVGVLRGLCRSIAFVNTLWKNSTSAPVDPEKLCPCCNKPMVKTSVAADASKFALELDVCRSCQMVWFDPAELSCVELSEEKQEQMPQRAREIMAEYQVREMGKAAVTGSITQPRSGDVGPWQWWKWLPGIVGFPVEMDDSEKLKRFPLWTLGLAVLCATLFFLTFKDHAAILSRFGFFPAQPFREYGATLFSSMVLHGSAWHLVGNLYFLLTFGDDVEDELGWVKMGALIFLSGLSALLFYALWGADKNIPCVGASGFISGIIAFYSVTFPWRRLGFCVIRRRWGLLCSEEHSWIAFPAWLLFVCWLIWQVVMVWITSRTAGAVGGGVAWTAHIGGAIPGVVWGLLQRKFSR